MLAGLGATVLVVVTTVVPAVAGADARPGPRSGTGTVPQATLSVRVSLDRVAVGDRVLLSTQGGSGTGAVTFAVVGGTSTGCALSGDVLTSTSAGTCAVRATKAADATYAAAASAPVTVSFVPTVYDPVYPPGPVAVRFGPRGSALGPGDREVLARLARELRSGAVVRLVARGPGGASALLARAVAVRRYLVTRTSLRVRIVLRAGGPAAVEVVTARP